MSSVESLREFVTERLTAAAEEIFTVFQQTVAEYEEELGRQRRLLDIVLKPELKLHRTELPQQLVFKKTEVLSEQQLCELPQQLVFKKTEVLSEQQLCELPQQRVFKKTEVLSEQQLCELPQQRVFKKTEVLSEQQLCELPQQRVFKKTEVLSEQQRNSSVDQEEPEPPQVKEEEEEVCSSQEGEQLVLKQETDTFMLTPTHEGSDHREPEPTSDQQLLSHSSPVAENRHQEGGGHVDPEPAGNVGTQPQKRRRENTSDSDNVHNMSAAFCDTQTDDKSFECFFCGKSFRWKSRLLLHLRIHTGEKPYSCETCGKRFIVTSELNRHRIVHTGERPFSCDVCGKGFFRTTHLKRHILLHTGGAVFGL